MEKPRYKLRRNVNVLTLLNAVGISYQNQHTTSSLMKERRELAKKEKTKAQEEEGDANVIQFHLLVQFQQL